MATRTFRAMGLSLTLVAAIGCGGESTAPAPTATAPPAPSPLTTAQRAQWYQDCWGYFNDKAWDKFQTCYAENAVSEQVDSPVGTSRGRAAIIKATQDMVTSFPDVKGDLKLVLAHGPHAVSVALWHGTNTGPMPGPDGKSIPATKKPFGFLMAHMVETDAMGKEAIRDAGYVEEGTMMAQLGLVKAPARAVMPSEPATPTVVIAKNDEAEAKNVAVVHTHFEAFNRHDVKAVDASLAPTYTLREVAMPKDHDKKGAVAAVAELFKGFPDVKLTNSDVWGIGEYVVALGTFTGTNKGGMRSMGLKKTGKPAEIKYLEIFRLQDGKIAEDWLFYNGASFMTQIGM